MIPPIVTTARRLAIPFSLLALFATGELFAGSATAPMHVSATVVARAIVSVDSAPETVEVTASDLARGYVDVAAPLVVRLRTNSRAGCLLRAESLTGDLPKVELSFGDSQMTLSGSESWMHRPYVPGGEVLSMRMRVYLRENAHEGAYPVTIALNAQPL